MEARFSFCECLLQCLHKLLEKNLEASLEHVHLSGPGASGRQHAVIEKLGAQQSPEVCRDQFPYNIKSTHPPLPIYDTLVTGMLRPGVGVDGKKCKFANIEGNFEKSV